MKTKIEIMSIQDLLHMPKLKDLYGVIIIFVTTKSNYYNFGHTLFYYLDIADTKAPVITRQTIITLKKILECKLEINTYYDTIYVCCDAGLSRSPAVAFFLATKLGDHKRALEIDDKYRFLNVALFKKLMVEI